MTGKMAFALLMGLNLGAIFLNLPPALDPLMDLYGVSYTRISVLISALLWSHALMQVPAGMIADRLGVGRTLKMSLIAMAAGNLLPALAADFGLAVAGRVVTGIGTGLSFVTTMKFIALHAPDNRSGSYQAFFAGFFSIGSILAYLFVPWAAAAGWRMIYLAPETSCLPLLAVLFAMRLGPDTVHSKAPLPLGSILRIKTGWVLGLYHALSYGAMLNLGNWIPSLLAEVWAKDTAVGFAWGGALVMMVSGAGRLSGGFILMRFSPLAMANGSIVVLSAIFLGLYGFSSPSLVLPLSLLAAWFASINFGAFFLLASRAVSTESLATFFGFINLLANLGAILFTIMFGWVKDSLGSFSWGFGILTLLSLGAFLVGRSVLNGPMKASPS
jgi:MFS family permease